MKNKERLKQLQEQINLLNAEKKSIRTEMRKQACIKYFGIEPKVGMTVEYERWESNEREIDTLVRKVDKIATINFENNGSWLLTLKKKDNRFAYRFQTIGDLRFFGMKIKLEA